MPSFVLLKQIHVLIGIKGSLISVFSVYTFKMPIDSDLLIL